MPTLSTLFRSALLVCAIASCAAPVFSQPSVQRQVLEVTETYSGSAPTEKEARDALAQRVRHYTETVYPQSCLGEYKVRHDLKVRFVKYHRCEVLSVAQTDCVSANMEAATKWGPKTSCTVKIRLRIDADTEPSSR